MQRYQSKGYPTNPISFHNGHLTTGSIQPFHIRKWNFNKKNGIIRKIVWICQWWKITLVRTSWQRNLITIECWCGVLNKINHLLKYIILQYSLPQKSSVALAQWMKWIQKRDMFTKCLFLYERNFLPDTIYMCIHFSSLLLLLLLLLFFFFFFFFFWGGGVFIHSVSWINGKFLHSLNNVSSSILMNQLITHRNWNYICCPSFSPTAFQRLSILDIWHLAVWILNMLLSDHPFWVFWVGCTLYKMNGRKAPLIANEPSVIMASPFE